MRRAALLIPLSLAACLPGCLALPIPTSSHNPAQFGSRAEPDTPTLDSLRDGQSTREQILLSLGEPDRSWDGDRIFLYVYDTAGGMIAYAVGGGQRGAIGRFYTGDKYLLLLQFDQRGTLVRHDIKSTLLTTPRSEVVQIAEKWAADGPGRSTH